MHAWAVLKPGDIVSAACALRDMVAGVKPKGEAQDVRPAEAPPADDARAGGSAPAE